VAERRLCKWREKKKIFKFKEKSTFEKYDLQV